MCWGVPPPALTQPAEGLLGSLWDLGPCPWSLGVTGPGESDPHREEVRVMATGYTGQRAQGKGRDMDPPSDGGGGRGCFCSALPQTLWKKTGNPPSTFHPPP